MNSMLLAPLLIGAFAYVATNWGEHRMLKPGWRPTIIALLWCLAGYLAWPLWSGFVVWAMPK